MTPAQRRELISRCMVRGLRHGEDIDIVKVRRDGYADILDLLKMQEIRGLGGTLEDVYEILTEQDQEGAKARFKYLKSEDDGQQYLRSIQGHSRKLGERLDMDEIMQHVQPGDEHWIDVGLHGAFFANASSIAVQGLRSK